MAVQLVSCGMFLPITKTIQVRRTRHAGHCWRSRDELIRDVLLWIPTHGRAKAGRPARTYIQQLCEDTGCCPEDLPRAMNDREEWWERVRDIRAASTRWWWWWCLHNPMHKRQANSHKCTESQCYVLTCWPGQKCHSRWCTGRKWHIPVAGNRKRLRRRWGVSILLRGSLTGNIRPTNWRQLEIDEKEGKQYSGRRW